MTNKITKKENKQHRQKEIQGNDVDNVLVGMCNDSMKAVVYASIVIHAINSAAKSIQESNNINNKNINYYDTITATSYYDYFIFPLFHFLHYSLSFSL